MDMVALALPLLDRSIHRSIGRSFKAPSSPAVHQGLAAPCLRADILRDHGRRGVGEHKLRGQLEAAGLGQVLHAESHDIHVDEGMHVHVPCRNHLRVS